MVSDSLEICLLLIPVCKVYPWQNKYLSSSDGARQKHVNYHNNEDTFVWTRSRHLETKTKHKINIPQN